MDVDTISSAVSIISQGASDVLEPIPNQAAHQETYIVPWQMAHPQQPRTYHQPKTYRISWQEDRYQDHTIQSATTTELACNLAPTTNVVELEKYHHQSVRSPTKAALL